MGWEGISCTSHGWNGTVGETQESAQHGVFYRDSSETFPVKTELGCSWEQLKQQKELRQLFLPPGCFSLQAVV